MPSNHHTFTGDRRICIAVLDGPVDRAHPCFQGADLTALPTLVPETARHDGTMSGHGTRVASIIFGQPGSEVSGIAPHCRGLVVPIFADGRASATQLDMARAIEQAANAGAHVINISRGSLRIWGKPKAGWLMPFVFAKSATSCLWPPPATTAAPACMSLRPPNVLAVGAMDAQGQPLDFSNWGSTYQAQGILAPGEAVLGAKPGGGTERLSGTSFAAPMVSGTAALLLSQQVQRGEDPDPTRVRQLLLQSALPCNTDNRPADPQRCLAGQLNLAGAITLLTGGTMSEELEAVAPAGVTASGNCGCDGGLTTLDPSAPDHAPRLGRPRAISSQRQSKPPSRARPPLSHPLTTHLPSQHL